MSTHILLFSFRALSSTEEILTWIKISPRIKAAIVYKSPGYYNNKITTMLFITRH